MDPDSKPGSARMGKKAKSRPFPPGEKLTKRTSTSSIVPDEVPELEFDGDVLEEAEPEKPASLLVLDETPKKKRALV